MMMTPTALSHCNFFIDFFEWRRENIQLIKKHQRCTKMIKDYPILKREMEDCRRLCDDKHVSRKPVLKLAYLENKLEYDLSKLEEEFNELDAILWDRLEEFEVTFFDEFGFYLSFEQHCFLSRKDILKYASDAINNYRERIYNAYPLLGYINNIESFFESSFE